MGLPHPIRATVETVAQGARLPYHGIFSRGILRRWVKSGWATPQGELRPEAGWWDICAPLIEDTWNYWANRPEIRDLSDKIKPEPIRERFEQAGRLLFAYLTSSQVSISQVKPYASIPAPIAVGMVDTALGAGLCSFNQVLVAASDHLAREKGAALIEYSRCAGDRLLSEEHIRQVELVNVKEGHTASIVRVAVWQHGVEDPVLFGLNVARDLTDAADELSANWRDLAHWATLEPQDVARVYGAGEGSCAWFGRQTPLPLIAVTWFDAARELHVVRNPAAPNRGLFVLVEEFRQSSGPLPEMIGPLLEESISDSLWAAIIARRTRLAQIDWQSETVQAPDLELNHGDVVGEVRDDDIRIAFVASSTRRWRGPIGAWPYEMALCSARDDRSSTYRRIYWGKPTRALEAVYQGVLHQLPHDRENAKKLALRMFESSLSLDVDRLVSCISVPVDREDGWTLLLNTRRQILSFLNRLRAGTPK